MKLMKSVSSAMRYVMEAANRMFSRSEDNYPATGVQPFEGDPNRNRASNH